MEEIAVGSFDYDNIIASLFSIIAQIDKRTAEDSRKMDILRKSMENKGYLNDNALTITEYMNCVAMLHDKVVGTIYYEFSCLNGNEYAQMFCEVIENYSMLPKMEKKSKKLEVIIDNIMQEHGMDSDTVFSTNEIYDYFIEGKVDYLTAIRESVEIECSNENAVTDDNDYYEDDEENQEMLENNVHKGFLTALNDDDVYDLFLLDIESTVDENIENISKPIYPIYKGNTLVSKQDKVRKFMGKVGVRATGEILGIIDTSLTGNGGDGLLFTTEGISFDHAFEKVFLRYDEISYMEFNKRETELRFIGYFGGVKDNCITPSINNTFYNLHSLKDLLEKLIKIYISYTR
jgi:hypothetical protein